MTCAKPVATRKDIIHTLTPEHLTEDPASSAYTYGRYHNPIWTAYEHAITELERGAATVAFSSGMAAVAATLGVTLKAGNKLAMPSDCARGRFFPLL